MAQTIGELKLLIGSVSYKGNVTFDDIYDVFE